MLKSKLIVLAALMSLLPAQSHASWDALVNKVEQSIQQVTATTVAMPSDQAIAEALKQALDQGVKASVRQLGIHNGFLNDAAVKIPMPKMLKKVDKGLRKIGQAKVADEFIETMNHAAEKAVAQTVTILADAVRAMTLKDAVTILNGKQDAATQYFKRNSAAALRNKIKPVVHEATDSVGLTENYKKLVSKAGVFSKYIDKDSLDLDLYITEKAIDGLFLKIATEEKRIRKDPLARGSDVLKQVFGSLDK